MLEAFGTLAAPAADLPLPQSEIDCHHFTETQLKAEQAMSEQATAASSDPIWTQH